VGVGRPSVISSQSETGDEPACSNLFLRIDIGNLLHDKEAPLDMNEITFLAETLEVSVTTEQCA
jgi:hypothetical protein